MAEIDGVKLHTEWYDSLGAHDAAPRFVFLLVHGIFSTTFSFQALIPKLQAYGDVLAVDLPGFGQSEKGMKYHHSYDQMGRTLEKLIAEKTADRPVIAVGHSMGGQVVLRLARQQPQRLKGMILLAPSAELPKSPRLFRMMTRFPFFTLWLRNYVQKKDPYTVLKTVVHDESLVTKAQAEIYAEPLKDRRFYHSLKRLIREREGDLSEREYKAIKIPALILWGENDRVLPVQSGERLAAALPDAVFYTLKSTGHLISEESPETVVTYIDAFLNERFNV
ncbi:pimeloyl-ACP methyl ester carboxylesterase [Salsuginibacillus halophilus]|uniref:Pimeloyl-ACP methyl ester carboxylesterase n=1 Tax=Salsuginibacillus halophilus TaxID=517424 RepID=A0A2P8HYS1_9BACI|nr:alpha/beta hydrolase [Salsuginibacillus halophilus]PSL51335.1 pimeloyl-ACP methyl ester carboxylesterase [Salsuginibacillus halophilus]